MKSRLCRFLALLVLLETVALVLLVVQRTHFVVKKNFTPITIVESQIALALKYEAPEERFEEIVKKNLPALEYRPTTESFTILGDCALLRCTNYVRILLKNGASAQTAINDLGNLQYCKLKVKEACRAGVSPHY